MLPGPSITATSDYREALPLMFVFEARVERVCINVSTVADFTYEEDETFSVLLSSELESLTIGDGVSTVYIIDDDGEYL